MSIYEFQRVQPHHGIGAACEVISEKTGRSRHDDMSWFARKCMIFKRYLYVYPSVGGLVENEFSVSDDILRIAVKESGLVCRVDFERTLLRPAVSAVVPVPEGNPYHSAVIVPDLHRVPVRLVGQGLLCDDSAVVLERQPQRKRTLPPYPDTVGVVTSPTGAVIHDIMNVSLRRDPQARILLCPVRAEAGGLGGEAG